MEREIDHSVIETARGGDSTAITAIVSRFTQSLVRYVRSIVGDTHDAEDVAQQTFVNAIQRLSTYDPAKGAFSTWLFRIGRNAALNHLRSQRRSPVRFGTPLPAAGTHDKRTDNDPAARAVVREQFERLDAALAKLPQEQRSAWLLLEVEQRSISQIAEIEDVAPGTIKSRVSRARDALRKTVSLQEVREP